MALTNVCCYYSEHFHIILQYFSFILERESTSPVLSQCNKDVKAAYYCMLAECKIWTLPKCSQEVCATGGLSHVL